MSMERRTFLKISGMALASVPLWGRLAAAADAALPLAKETEEPAKALKFCPNADKPSANCAARKDKAKDGQFCHNCQLFTRLSGDQKEATGKCMIMPKSTVPGRAWCMSWVKAPG